MTVKDPEKLNAYAKLAAQGSAKHGGIVLARGGVGAGKVLSLEVFDQSRDKLNYLTILICGSS